MILVLMLMLALVPILASSSFSQRTNIRALILALVLMPCVASENQALSIHKDGFSVPLTLT